MGLFRFFKRSKKPQEEVVKEKYWSLSTNDSEVIDPTWKQVVGDKDGDWYRFEALPPNGEFYVNKIYVNDGISYVETVRLFKEYFKYQRITGVRSWPTEKV